MIITLAQVKTYLGITDTTYDAQITAYLPIIESKVKAICGSQFHDAIVGDTTIDSPSVAVSTFNTDTWYLYNRSERNIDQPYQPEDLQEYLQYGQQITGDNIPAGAYIIEITFDPDYLNPIITLSDNATATAAGSRLYAGFNIAYHPTVAKGIWWLIDQTSTSIKWDSLSSRRMGPVSITYSGDDAKIDNRYGMPAGFVKGLPRYRSAH